MERLDWLLLALAGAALLYALWLRWHLGRQIAELGRMLEEVQAGNGNRRVLARPGQITAPLVYALNTLIDTYEERLVRGRRAEENNRTLMTGLAHDLRTPLTTLIGYQDAVHRGDVTGQQREEYLAAARRKAYELKACLEQLFDWFRLHAGEFPLTPVPTEAVELTRGLLAGWVPLLEEQGMDYSFDIPEGPFRVCLDPDGYARVLNNLLQNVLTHSRASRLQVVVERQGQTLQVTVADNGVGIAGADLDRIFERLYRCDPSRSGKGSGLGLSIVRELVTRMGGQITVRSAPGHGTRFLLCFPLTR